MFVGVKLSPGVYRSTVERFDVSFPEKLLKIVAILEARFLA